MPAEISFEGLPEARARLAAMPRKQVEAAVLSAINDCTVMAAGYIEMQHLISEARNFIKKSNYERADKRLAEAPPFSGDSPTSVPAGVVLQ